MRQREMQMILANAVKKDFGLNGVNQAGGYKFTNLIRFKKFLHGIEALTMFKDEIHLLKNSPLFSTALDELIVNPGVGLQIHAQSAYLSNAAEALLRVLNTMLVPQDENTVSILLPKPANFHSLINVLTAFEKSISQVITNDKINGNLKINTWEAGSFWIELFLGTQAAVLLIAGVAWSAAVIAKKYNEAAILAQHVRSLKIKNESLDDILEKQKEMTSLLIENETEQLLVKHFNKESDPELSERLKFAVKTFAELIQQGAEVHPALNAPEQVSNLFPNFKSLDTITSQIKQIESTKKESTPTA